MRSFQCGQVASSLSGRQRFIFALSFGALLGGCGGSPDAGPVPGDPDLATLSPPESGPKDASALDGNSKDASALDASAKDASALDASFKDASTLDASVFDASVKDASDAGLPDLGGDSDLGSGSKRLRIMAANTSTGTKQSYDPGEGLRIFQGIHPDIALIQEFNYGDNSATTIRGFVTTAFGSAFSYFRETGAQIPNAVASRYPILSSGSWTDPAVSNRGFAWARIDIPGSKDLWAVSVHLLTTSASNRDAEAKALVADLSKSVPAGDYIVIGGDLNSGTRTEACLTSFSAIVSVSAPYPADALGNENTSGSRSKPHDWVMPSPNLRMLETGVLIGAHTFPNGLVVDSRVYTPLADIAPVLLGDSGVPNMQHMAVVQDFLLP